MRITMDNHDKEVKPLDSAARKRAPKLTPEELDRLEQQMIRNLSDPEVAKRVDQAEDDREEALREAANRIGRSRP